MKTIQLLGLVDGTSLPKFDGKYVVSYDPMKWVYRDVSSVEEMERFISEWLVVTDDPKQAKQFESMPLAHAYWIQLGPGVRPWDGKPNKPLTAFSVTITDVPDPGGNDFVLRASFDGERDDVR